MAKLHTVYGPELTVQSSKWVTHQKPAYVADYARLKGAVEHKLESRASKKQLRDVHSDQYVDGVLFGTINNGFGNKDRCVTEQARWASGAMLQGMKVALEEGNCLVPASGFHHASYDKNWGFCTFNGMMLAALHSQKKTLIIDGDAHYGDGCVNIIKELGVQKDIHYMQCFDPLMDVSLIKDYELVIYQPGADSLEEGEQLTYADFALRDFNVFEEVKHRNVPILWCLGGGYSSFGNVVKAHHGSINILTNVLDLSRKVGGRSHPQVIDGTSQEVVSRPSKI